MQASGFEDRAAPSACLRDADAHLSSPGSRYDRGVQGCSEDLTEVTRDTDLLDLRPVLRELVLVRHDACCSYNNLFKISQKSFYRWIYSENMRRSRRVAMGVWT
jgi:hypothetical protein